MRWWGVAPRHDERSVSRRDQHWQSSRGFVFRRVGGHRQGKESNPPPTPRCRPVVLKTRWAAGPNPLPGNTGAVAPEHSVSLPHLPRWRHCAACPRVACPRRQPLLRQHRRHRRPPDHRRPHRGKPRSDRTRDLLHQHGQGLPTLPSPPAQAPPAATGTRGPVRTRWAQCPGPPAVVAPRMGARNASFARCTRRARRRARRHHARLDGLLKPARRGPWQVARCRQRLKPHAVGKLARLLGGQIGRAPKHEIGRPLPGKRVRQLPPRGNCAIFCIADQHPQQRLIALDQCRLEGSQPAAVAHQNQARFAAQQTDDNLGIAPVHRVQVSPEQSRVRGPQHCHGHRVDAPCRAAGNRRFANPTRALCAHSAGTGQPGRGNGRIRRPPGRQEKQTTYTHCISRRFHHRVRPRAALLTGHRRGRR